MIISQLRQQLTSGLLQWIILVICLGMAISLVIPGGKSPQQSPTGISEWIVRVDGTEISRAQYDLQINTAKRRFQLLRTQLGAVADQLFGSLNIPEIALSELINAAVVDHAAKNSNLGIDRLAVLRSIARTIPTDFLTGDGLPDLVRIAPLLPAGLTVDQWITDESRQIVHDQYLTLIRAAGFIPAMAASYEHMHNAQKARYSYGVLKDQDFRTQIEKKPIDDAALQLLYDKKTGVNTAFWVPESRVGRVWEISPRSYDIAVSDQEVSEYYERVKQKRFVVTPARIIGLVAICDTRDEAVELKKNPALFAQKATKVTVSKDAPGSPEGRVKALFAIAHNEKFSEVYQNGEKFEIAQRLSKTPEVLVPLSSVAAQIRAELEAQRFSRLFTKEIRMAIDNDEGMAYVASRGAKLNTITVHGGDETPVARELFAKSLGQWGFYLDNKNGYVFVVDSIEKPRKKKFSEVKDILRGEYVNNQVRNAREQAVQKAIESQQGVSEWAVEVTEPISRSELGALLTKKGIPSTESSLRQLRVVGDIVALPTAQGVALVRVKEIDVPKATTGASVPAELLQQKYGALPGQGFIAAAHQQATIERNTEL